MRHAINFIILNMNERIKWTYGENLLCCEVYIKNYVINNTVLSLKEAINEVLKAAPRFKGGKEGSVRIKLQNIKQLCIEHKVDDSFTYKAQAHYSKDNIKAFEEVLDKYNIAYKK